MSVCILCVCVFVDIHLGMKKEGEKKGKNKINHRENVNLCAYQFVYS